jgi:DNA-binding response OmpR family regulator
VLLVEDNSELNDLTAAQLERHGFEVFKTQNGHDAWSVLQKYPIKIILSDMTMPGMTGIELLKKIRMSGGKQVFIFFVGDGRSGLFSKYAFLDIFEVLEKGSASAVLDVVKRAARTIERPACLQIDRALS